MGFISPVTLVALAVPSPIEPLPPSSKNETNHLASRHLQSSDIRRRPTLNGDWVDRAKCKTPDLRRTLHSARLDWDKKRSVIVPTRSEGSHAIRQAQMRAVGVAEKLGGENGAVFVHDHTDTGL